MLSGKLSYQIQLYQKIRTEDGRGGKQITWQSLGFTWACITPYGHHYPFAKNGKQQERGEAYEVILRQEPRIVLVDKIVWKETDYFLLHSPHQNEAGYVRLHVFSWSC